MSSNIETIIPYASKYVMLRAEKEVPSLGYILSFGPSIDSAVYFEDNMDEIDFTSLGSSANSPIAFSMPRDGTITTISATLYINDIWTTDAQTSVRTKLFVAPANSEIYHSLADSTVYLQPIVKDGEKFITLTGKATNLNIKLTAETKLMMIMYCVANDSSINSATIYGLASGGISMI